MNHLRFSGNRLIRFGILIVGLMLLFGQAPTYPVRADVAPPSSPPGTNLAPGMEVTQVRMMWEEVTLDVQARNNGKWLGQAKVSAVFSMRNLGSETETMQVRFPLSFWNGRSDGFGRYPEIMDLRVQVQGRPVSLKRVMEPNPSKYDDTPIPWATFSGTFPPGEDVEITLTYTADGYGEYPNVAFDYILETGAGWKDTIGRADIIVRLPYDVTDQNIIFDESTGYSSTTPNAQVVGDELRWQFEDLEPTSAHNIEVALVNPEVWNKVQLERDRVRQNPKDGEAWGRLGKLYKEISQLRRAMRQDPGGKELYQLSQEAYQKAVTLKPHDSLWHYGYADLLWFHYYWHVFYENPQDMTELVQAVQELRKSLESDPGNERARKMLEDINREIPGVIALDGNGYDYLILTATPQVTPFYIPQPTETEPLPLPTETLLPPPGSTQSILPVTELPETEAGESPTATVFLPPTGEPVLPTQMAARTPAVVANNPDEGPTGSPETDTHSEETAGRAGLKICGSILALPFAAVFLWKRQPRKQAD